jgi:hypothetical protein
MTEPTTTRHNPYLGTIFLRGGTVGEKHCRAPLDPDARNAYCSMSAKDLCAIVRILSLPDIPKHAPMGERTVVHKDDSDEYPKIKAHGAVACLTVLGQRQELLRKVLDLSVYARSCMPWKDTATDVAAFQRETNDATDILAMIRVVEKRQHAALPQPHQEPVTALQQALAKGLKYATEEATFASLCGLTATGSMSRKRQRIATVDPDNVLPWDRPSIGGEPTETEMTEARAWVLAHAAK